MKNFSKYSLMILAAATVGAALFALANADFTAGWNPDAALAIVPSVGLMALGFVDYARRPQFLSVTAPLLRPTLPMAAIPNPYRPSAKRARNSRVAA